MCRRVHIGLNLAFFFRFSVAFSIETRMNKVAVNKESSHSLIIFSWNYTPNHGITTGKSYQERQTSECTERVSYTSKLYIVPGLNVVNHWTMIKHEKSHVLFNHPFKSQHYVSVFNFFIDERNMFEYNHFVTTHFLHLVWDLEKKKQKKIYLNIRRNKHGVVIPDAEVKDKDLSFIFELDSSALEG